RLKKENGEVVVEEEEIREHIHNYYSTLFQSETCDRYDELLAQVPHKVTREMNDILTREYTNEEIKAALDAMGDLKALGEDGMPARFYKKFGILWGVMAVDEVLRGGVEPQGWNDTILVLIPKVQRPENLKDLRPISLCNVVYKIVSNVISNHLKLILPKNDQRSADTPEYVLSLYENCSGQMINKSKSSIMFSCNTMEDRKAILMNKLDIGCEAMTEKYLGLPVYLGRSKKKKSFAYLKERVWKRIQGWKEKLLSKEGKEVLINAIAQAMPSYAMSCFDITKGLCDDLSSMVCQYWWSPQDNENKMHWLSWEKLCSDKRGAGFRRSPHVLYARYYPDGDLLKAEESPGISYSWRNIIHGVKAVKQRLIWRVGTQVNIWLDPWIPDGILRRPVTPRRGVVLTRVAELIDPMTGQWDIELIKEIFWEEDVKKILAIPLRPNREDMLSWHYDTKGLFSVKSVYHDPEDSREREAVRQPRGSSTCNGEDGTLKWNKVWRLPRPPKMKHFLWRLAHDSLPLRRNIMRRGLNLDTL
ncbi:LOW QUALITY PROTEIN: hypothetical protein U9M48_038971, partial [Paspalum notatum var. saurae]